MAFLTDEDYLAQIDQDDLRDLTEADSTIRELAERNALSEVAGYLRGRFDMEAAYAQQGEDRNGQLVMTVVDVTLWHLMPRVTFRNVAEVRETRYKAALAWLKQVESGRGNPDLPRYGTTDAPGQAHRLFRYGSQQARSHEF
ncbi:phage protein Gp36 family protein [Hymenobacter sp. B81]|uniref:phage protein Gp36 family protein n=1 Tax=Hymenobacter sp. B81 TaxID=3344878 RepID=UPI0037DD11C3